MSLVTDYLIRHFTPPDIRKSYRLHRDVVHFLVRNAVRINDGHFDRTIRGRDGYDIPVRIYPPVRMDARTRIIVFFHGGGWVIDDVDRYHHVCRQLADMTNSYVISVNYRLAPEHKFPTGFNDCYDVCRYVYRAANINGISSHDVILMGDSSGGNLAAAVALKAKRRGHFKVRRQVLIYPAVSCEYGEDSPYPSVHEKGKGYILTAERLRGYLELYLNDPSEKDNKYAAPIKAEKLDGMPETLIITAENDPLRDEGEAYGKRLYREGNSVKVFRIKKAYHGFFNTDLKKNSNALKAISIIMYFLRLTD